VLPALEVFCGDPFLLVWPDIGVLLALFGGNDSLGLSDLVSSLLDGWSKERVVGVVQTSSESGCKEEVEEQCLRVEP
jgi:hypothetical protein